MAKAKAPIKLATSANAYDAVPLLDSDGEITAERFQDSFSEDIQLVLDLSTWRTGVDLNEEYRRVEREVREAVERETELQEQVRKYVFPRLREAPASPPCAGKHKANEELICRIHRGLLFNGGVEACDGIVQIHDSLPLSIYQTGVSMVSYRGDQGTWHQRLFRRDLRQKGITSLADAVELLERRSQRSAGRTGEADDSLGELAQKALLDYAERAILLRRSTATWRMGHGNPITYELLTGAGNLELMVASTKVLRELVEQHQKFIFVASEPRERFLLTIGQALHPMEFAIVETLKEQVEDWLKQKRFTIGVSSLLAWDDEQLIPSEWIPRFLNEVASQVVVGLFRASLAAPAQLFYAHVDHADLAAHIVLADSMLQEHRGFPLLLDLAHRLCRSVFGEDLEHMTQTAYAAAGAPWRYLNQNSRSSH